MINYLVYINTRLERAINDLDVLNEEEKNEAILLASINNIRNVIFEVLDYTINHFPGYTGDSNKLYFPILAPGDLRNLLFELKRNKNYIEIRKNIKEATRFVRKSYYIISKEPYATYFLWLNSASKHRNQDVVEHKENQVINGSFFGPENSLPKNKDNEGFYNFSLEDGISLRAKNFDLKNVDMQTNLGLTKINCYRTVNITENLLTVYKNKEEKSVSIKFFLKICLECCQKIIDLWQFMGEVNKNNIKK